MSEEAIASMREDIREMKDALTNLAEAVTKLAVLETKQVEASNAIGRAFDQIGRNEKRIRNIELELPAMKLASQWVFRALIASTGMLGALALAVLTKELMG